MTYHHLTYHDRIQINALLQVEVTPIEIAKKLNRPKSTIYRELSRNSFQDFYYVETAQIYARERKSRASQDRFADEEIDDMIAAGIRHGMSPAQISGRLKAEGAASASISMIYSRIKKDEIDGGDLWLCLRHSRKIYRKSYGTGIKDGGIKNRVFIEERADIVEYRERFGDLEGDTIIGAKQKGVLLTMNDRVTKKVSIDKLKSKKSDEVCDAMITATATKFAGKKHTCTLDNGTEFAGHEDFTDATGVKVYFCNVRSPEERGSNENTNGLIRQYIPKGTDISKVSKVRIKFIEQSLNSRPRQSLNFLTPIEAESKGKIQSHFFS